MKRRTLSVVAVWTVLLPALFAQAEIEIAFEHNPAESAPAEFQFKTVPSPAQNDAATHARFILVEGMCNYIRWFLYEPQTRGAEITRRNIAQARYDSSYRISATFLNWVTQEYCRDIVPRLNAAARQGKYSEEIWKTATGHTVQELGDQWKAQMEKKVAEAKE
ncbi:MAG: hypothetical protein FJ280_21165 [Planctomycetes bacterium]|nr:hypothetical protein [Planctomycetota bacterium]